MPAAAKSQEPLIESRPARRVAFAPTLDEADEQRAQRSRVSEVQPRPHPPPRLKTTTEPSALEQAWLSHATSSRGKAPSALSSSSSLETAHAHPESMPGLRVGSATPHATVGQSQPSKHESKWSPTGSLRQLEPEQQSTV